MKHTGGSIPGRFIFREGISFPGTVHGDMSRKQTRNFLILRYTAIYKTCCQKHDPRHFSAVHRNLTTRPSDNMQ